LQAIFIEIRDVIFAASSEKESAESHKALISGDQISREAREKFGTPGKELMIDPEKAVRAHLHDSKKAIPRLSVVNWISR